MHVSQNDTGWIRENANWYTLNHFQHELRLQEEIITDNVLLLSA